MDLIKKVRDRLHLKKALNLIWQHDPVYAIALIVVLLLENFLLLVTLFYTRNLIGQIPFALQSIDNGSEEMLSRFLYAAGAAVLYIFVRTISTLIGEIQGSKLSLKVDKQIHEKAIKLGMSFYESPQYFDLLQRAKQSGSERPGMVLNNIVDLIKNIAFLFVVAGFVLFVSPWIIPLLLFFSLPTLLVRVRFSKRYHAWRSAQTEQERKANYYSYLLTDAGLAKEIKAFGLSDFFKEKYVRLQEYLVDEKLKISKRRLVFEFGSTFISIIGIYAVMGYLVWSALKGRSGFGDVAIVVAIIPQAFTSIQNLIGSVSILYQNNIYLGYLFQLFDLPEMNKEEKSNPLPEEINGIQIENLSFSYPGSTVEVLENISLQIPLGKITAIVGLNGSGKSTLVKLLLGLYELNSGIIKLGDSDIRYLDRGSYLHTISVVFQDFGKYHVSILENICLGDSRSMPDLERARQVLVQADGISIVQKFEKGFDTQLGKTFEQGEELSLGQWQKLAIARALYRPSRFIIFDEATSALDALAEHEIMLDLKQKIEGRGALVISHRLSAVKHADYIYVVSEGKIAEEGTHEQLLAANGTYAKIFLSKIIETNAID